MHKGNSSPILAVILILAAIFAFYWLSNGEPLEKYLQKPGQADANALDKNTLKIASWNLQVFGVAKAGNSELMKYYAGKIRNYDIVVVQEIRDASGTAFRLLCEDLGEYKCFTSSRAGKTQSKEQYGIIYKKARLVESKDYNPEKSAQFERSPFSATFSYGNWTFRLVTLHADPDLADEEIAMLEEMFKNSEDDVIILGDLNADCDYFDDENAGFETWLWAIPNNADTTVAKAECAYDRIIVNPAAKDNFLEYGIMKDVSETQSDHYLVYGIFSAD